MFIKAYSKDPSIIYFENLIKSSYCDEIIKYFCEKNLQPSKSSGPSNYRKSKSISINKDIEKLKPIFTILEKLFNSNLGDFEKPVLQKYSINDEYPDHFDAFNPLRNNIKNFVQRKNTIIIYLNDSFIGGETFFHEQNIIIKPKKGSLLIFENCFEGTNHIHPLSRHSGKKVIDGDKWIITLWSKTKDPINLENYL